MLSVLSRNILFRLLFIGTFMQCTYLIAQTANGLEITHLTGDFYMYTTYQNLNGSPFPSNSMYLVTSKGVVLFDTPWDSLQFKPLLDSIQTKHNLTAVMCISTHFHADRTAGINYYKSLGIPTFSSKQTFELCALHDENQPAYYFSNDTVFTIGDHSFSTFYPGAGHSPDNIVIWFEDEKILYGGCLVKSTEVNNLGNLSDADIASWKTAIEKLIKKYPDAEFIIPGHFGWNSKKSLQHTFRLLRKYEKNN